MSDSDTLSGGRLRERTAEEIRVILARRRMSATELARRTGMKQPYISRRMTGEIAFDLDDLEVIAATLGVKVADLLGGNGAQTTLPKLRLTGQVTSGSVVRSMADRAGAAASRPRDNWPSGRAARAATAPTSRRPVPLRGAVADLESAA